MPSAPIVILVAIALVSSFLSGAKDGANSLATLVTSRAVSPGWALWIAALAEFAGPFIFGVAVARTIASGIVEPGRVSVLAVIAALLGSGIWNALMWWLGLPTSASHAMVGGLIGAALAENRFNLGVLQRAGLLTTAEGLFLAPVVGLLIAYIVTRILTLLVRNAPPRINWFFKRGQILTTLALALSYGANDAPKVMGMIVLGLMAAHVLPGFQVPLWVILSGAATVAAGTALGSQRMIRTIGTRFYRVRPYDAFNSQLTSALIVVVASLAGSPVSTSQVVSSAIVGVGAADRLSKVRWGVLNEIVLGWILTIPATVVAGGVVFWLLRLIGGG